MARKKAVESPVKAVEIAEAVETMTEDIKAEETAAETAAKPKKAPAKRKSAKTAKEAETVIAEEPVKEEAVMEEAPKKSSKVSSKAAKEAGQKSVLHIQYGGKSFSEEVLLKSARDIWEYDLKREAGELSSVELYVKPEENKVYYVMNEDVKGSFDI